MQSLIKLLFSPLAFGVGFLAPLVAQSLELASVSTGAVPPIVIGLLVGVGLGLMAQLRGSWICLKPS